MASSEHLGILEPGVGQWRKDYPNVGPDLSRADLSGTTLTAANLSAVDLTGADFPGARLGDRTNI